MGQNFVSIDFGERQRPLLEVATRPLATVEQPDLSAMMAKTDDAATGVQNLTKSFTGERSTICSGLSPIS